MRSLPYHEYEIRRALELADALGHDKCRISTLSLRTVLRILKDHDHCCRDRISGTNGAISPRAVDLPTGDW